MVMIKCLAIIAILFSIATSFKEQVFLTFKRTIYNLHSIEQNYHQESLVSQIIWNLAISSKYNKPFKLPAEITWQNEIYQLRLNDYHNLLDITDLKSQQNIKTKIFLQRDSSLKEENRNYYQELLAYINLRTQKNYLHQTSIQFVGEIYWLPTSIQYIQKIRNQISESQLPLAPIISTANNNILPSFFYTDSNLVTDFLGLNNEENKQIIQLQSQAFINNKIPTIFNQKSKLINLLNQVYDTSSLKLPNDLHLTIILPTQSKTLRLTFPTNFFKHSEQKVIYIWEQE